MSGIQIVRSKLRPPRLASGLVVRAALVERLEAGSLRPLTLLSAPAGYGKTTLVAQWLDTREGSAAWLALDRDDGELTTFAGYLVAAIRAVVPDACAETLSVLEKAERPSLSTLAATLSNDLEALPAPLVVVLDGYHQIDAEETHALLNRLLAHPPVCLHLLIITRRDPPLALSALRARQALFEIRVRDLQFSLSEYASLIEGGMGRVPSDEVLARLYESGEGWPAAVRLAASTLRQSGDAELCQDGFAGSALPVRNYFLEEVLAQQPEAVCTGLLETSILDQFSPSLCEAILGPRADTSFVSHVAAGDLFCTAVDEEHEWYRFHPLFHGFLRRQLEKRYSHDALCERHRRAARWFETRGELKAAVTHWLAAGDVDSALCSTVRLGGMRVFDRGQRRQLAQCLRLLPANAVEQTAELLLLRAWLRYHQGRHLETSPVLDRIDALIATPAASFEPRTLAILSGSVSALRAVQCYLGGDADLALATAEEALQRLPSECLPERAIAQSVVAGSWQLRGDLGQARHSIQVALAQSTASELAYRAPLTAALGLIHWMAADLSALQLTVRDYYGINDAALVADDEVALGRYFSGIVYYQRNELAKAEATLRPALLPELVPRLGFRTEISFALAAVHHAQGKVELARELVDSVCAHLEQNGDSPALFRARAFQASLALRQGRLGEAANWARCFDPGPVRFAYCFFALPHLTLAQVWIADGSAENREQADRLLHLLEAEFVSRHNVRFLIEVLALQGVLKLIRGEEAAACERLHRALALAQPGGFVRLFVDSGPGLARLLKRPEFSAGSEADTRYIEQILAAFKDELLIDGGRRRHAESELTRREVKILKLLAERLTNVEISEQLCISRATVKRHTQNIYRKLLASNRREAVLRARALSILPDA